MPLEEDELYQERILDHYEEPFHRGRCPAATHAPRGRQSALWRCRARRIGDRAGRHDSRRLLRRRRLLHQPGRGLDADRTDQRLPVGRGQDFHRRRHAEPVRRQADAQSAEVLPAVVAGACNRPSIRPLVDRWRRLPEPRRLARPLHGLDAGLAFAPIFRFSPACCMPTHSAPACRWSISTTPPRTQRPRQVIQSMVDVYEQHYANVHRGIHWLSDQSTDLYEEAREQGAGVHRRRSREEVIFTHGTTESINLVARSWGDANLRAGDEILLTEMEHHSNIVPWQQVAARTGAVVRFLPITDDGRLDLDALDALLDRAHPHRGGDGGLERAGHDQSAGRDRRAGARGRRGRAGRRGPERAAPADRRAARWASTFWPSAATRCWGPRASACCMAGANCSKRCRRFWAAAA